jgi:Ca-activated chloride channel family protein
MNAKEQAGTLAVLAAMLLTVAHASPGQDTLRVDVGMVSLVATVTNGEGAYVQGLDDADFIVEDNGVPQEIAHFSEDTTRPVSLGIALDTSGSMVGRMRTALRALNRFVDALQPDDEIVVTTFSRRVSLVEGLTADRERLSRALGDVDVAGGTALYDAVVDSIGRVQTGTHAKRAVVVLTDGADTLSETGLSDTLEEVRRAEVLVYALGIDTVRFADDSDHVRFDWPLTPIPGLPDLQAPSWTDDPVDLQVLEALARASGGKAFLVSGTWTDGTDAQIDAVLDEVAAELRSQYTLSYYPSEPADGRVHQLRVRIPGTDYTVRTRSSYRSPDPR